MTLLLRAARRSWAVRTVLKMVRERAGVRLWRRFLWTLWVRVRARGVVWYMASGTMTRELDVLLKSLRERHVCQRDARAFRTAALSFNAALGKLVAEIEADLLRKYSRIDSGKIRDRRGRPARMRWSGEAKR